MTRAARRVTLTLTLTDRRYRRAGRSDDSSGSESDSSDGGGGSPTKRAARKAADWLLMVGKVVSVEMDTNKKKKVRLQRQYCALTGPVCLVVGVKCVMVYTVQWTGVCGEVSGEEGDAIDWP